MRRLKYIGHISPFFFNRLPALGVVVDGKVKAGDSTLSFIDDPYENGLTVTIRSNGREFVCESQVDIENRKAAFK